MSYTHFDKVSGINGLAVGKKGVEVPVASVTGALYQQGVTVTASAAELNQYTVTAYIADANTAGSAFVVVPHAGNIVGLYAVNQVANTTTKTVLTAEIGGTPVTAPAWEIALDQAAGVASSSMPTAANAVTAGGVVEIVSDGGGTPVMPVMVTIVIAR